MWGEPPAPDDAPGVRLSPVIVGRSDLLDLARRRWRAAESGTGAGQVLFLAGEAGIGKSRLLRELAAQVRSASGLVVSAAAFPPDLETAGGVLVDLASSAGRAADPVIVAAGESVAARLREDPSADGDAHHRRRVLVADVADAVLSFAGGASAVLVCLEDLHWADDLSLEVVDRIAQHLGSQRLLVVGTYRSDELFPHVPMRRWRTRLLNQRLAEEARLARLTREETARLCETITGSPPASAVADLVYRRSDGIPLHIEELLASVSAWDSYGVAVPQTLADAVLARADALSSAARELADAAAVIGRSFDLDMLAAVADVDPSTVDNGLRELVDQNLVVPSHAQTEYEFRHALIRDALYARLAPHRRRGLHAAVARAAAEVREVRAAFVSAQYELAHQPEPAYRYARTAATAAIAVSAHREAVDLLRRAQRTEPVAISMTERAGLLIELATELAATDDNAAAAEAYARAHELLSTAGDVPAAAALVPAWVAARHLLGADLAERIGRLRAALEQLGPAEPAIQSRLEAGLAAAYMLARRLDESIEHGERARALAAPDDPALFNVDVSLGSTLVFAGRMKEGWQLLEEAAGRAERSRAEGEAARALRMIGSSSSVLVEYERAGWWLREGIAYAERTERWNDRHYMAAHLAHVLWATGDWDGADRAARQAEADGRGGITTHITALHVLGYVALGRGDDQARRHLDEARELGEQMAELQRLSPALWGLAELAVHSGRLDEAVEWCERGYAGSAQVSDAAYLFPFTVTGVRARLGRDDISGARDWLARCEALLHLRSIPGTLPALDHARGLLHLADGHAVKARAALQAAVAGWDERRRFWEGSLARLDLARSASRSRRASEVATLVRQVVERADRVGSTVLRRSAGAVRPGRPAPVEDTGPLSPREAEVARLIASGATNREIAATLRIAPKTVSAHVEHILTKLGAGRRAEIAAWAAGRTRA
jgi:DNA-binding CsgD family transcriptional regulator/tetratricopeptide (TPR) repeat protein